MFTVMDVKQSRPGMTSQELEYLASGLSNGLRPTDLEEKDFVVDVHRICNMSFGCKDPSMKFTGKKHVLISSDDISRALGYLFSKASAEVKHFNKAEFLKKISIERNGILFSRSRLLDGQRFQEAGGLEDLNILDDLNIRLCTPVLDRFSPLSYSVADYIHRRVAKHKGYENCHRECLNYCFIIQGMSLFREISEDCIKCSKLRKKFFEISMGSISDTQLMIAPAFWVCQLDIFGPCRVYVPDGCLPYNESL